MAFPWNLGYGSSNVTEMTPFNRPYHFLLVCHCNYSYIVYHLQVIWRSKYCDDDLGYWSLKLKVIGNGTIGQITYEFLYIFHYKYVSYLLSLPSASNIGVTLKSGLGSLKLTVILVCRRNLISALALALGVSHIMRSINVLILTTASSYLTSIYYKTWNRGSGSLKLIGNGTIW